MEETAAPGDLRIPRVCLFADSFHEVNGVARTCRRLEEFIRRRGYPLLSIHCGPRPERLTDGAATVVQIERAPASIRIDSDLHFDLALPFEVDEFRARVAAFRPDIIHLTGPGDLGILGARVAESLHIPVILAWHTNLHEFAAMRLRGLLRALPERAREAAARRAESLVLEAVCRFYRLGAGVLAPNRELMEMLEARTGRRAFLMERGVDTAFFRPENRNRTEGGFVIGYTGRLTPEKNLRLLVDVERALLAAGHKDFRFLIVGGGPEKEHLRAELRSADFTGVIHGAELARAYAGMDVFAFPSRTDTYGNVVQEAMASGVPAVVTNAGGPKYLVETGVTGFVTETDGDFVARVRQLAGDPELLARMRVAARRKALERSWDAVFERVYDAYRISLGWR